MPELIAGRRARIVEHDTGIVLSRGPIKVYSIRDADDERFFLSRYKGWTDGRGPFMCDTYAPCEIDLMKGKGVVAQ